MRGAEAQNQSAELDAGRAGWYCVGDTYCMELPAPRLPPGLANDLPLRSNDGHAGKYSKSFMAESPRDKKTVSVNPWLGLYTRGIDLFNCAQSEGDSRSLLYGRDEWLVWIQPALRRLTSVFDLAYDRPHFEAIAHPFLDPIRADLRATILNRIGRFSAGRGDEFEQPSVEGLRNITVRGILGYDNWPRLPCRDYVVWNASTLETRVFVDAFSGHPENWIIVHTGNSPLARYISAQWVTVMPSILMNICNRSGWRSIEKNTINVPLSR